MTADFALHGMYYPRHKTMMANKNLLLGSQQSQFQTHQKREIIILFLSFLADCGAVGSAVLGSLIFLNIFNKILLIVIYITVYLYFYTILLLVDCPVSLCPSFRQFHSYSPLNKQKDGLAQR